eukprot:CAMPEP_0116962366 /NCGR_PEP_ID=MMETSP0467-20121206/47209_1 /TAXON_ID=283647 /ORGANISM="Mesodinium pulex, Strain SPMC105" /LENGTH=175 /DNA_ID=CAMNT_0004650663 /DNA_START=292 /DNA_END=821 /DNA_ORIENTATION=+
MLIILKANTNSTFRVWIRETPFWTSATTPKQNRFDLAQSAQSGEDPVGSGARAEDDLMKANNALLAEKMQNKKAAQEFADLKGRHESTLEEFESLQKENKYLTISVKELNRQNHVNFSNTQSDLDQMNIGERRGEKAEGEGVKGNGNGKEHSFEKEMDEINILVKCYRCFKSSCF